MTLKQKFARAVLACAFAGGVLGALQPADALANAALGVQPDVPTASDRPVRMNTTEQGTPFMPGAAIIIYYLLHDKSKQPTRSA